MRFQYGDLLRYPEQMDAGGLYRFMFLYENGDFNTVTIIQCPVDDDLWRVGTIILAGENELVRAYDD